MVPIWTIIALGMTVLMGGIIAYNGDVIGRKYGKKRLSMFGLRPKHTAILITSVTGVLISASTTAAIFLLTPPVRKVMLQGERAINENNALQVSNRNLARQKSIAESELAAEQQRFREAREKRREAEEQLAKARGNLTRAEDSVKRAENLRRTAESARAKALVERGQAVAEREQLRSETVQLKAEVANLKGRSVVLARGNVKLVEQNATLETRNKALGVRNQRLSTEVDEKIKQNQEYVQENAKIARQNEELIRDNGLLEQQNAQLAVQRDKIREVLDRSEERHRELTQKIGTLQEQSKQLEQIATIGITTLYATLEALRTRPVAVHTGEDLARVTIPAASTPEQVREYLKQLTRSASEAAKAKGADTGDRPTMLAVQIVDKRTLAQTPFGVREVSISEEEQINQIITATSSSDVPVCVLAMAAGNSVRGEPAIIDLQPLADRLVYPRGRLVATRRVDANRPPEAVFMDLVRFLKDVGRSAVERGMIPRLDPMTGEPQVGALDWPDLVRLVERVRGAGKNVQVSAMAAGDTTASGPLRLEFKVQGTL